MPLHLNSFVEEKKDKKIFAEILDLCIKAQNPISSDGATKGRSQLEVSES